MIQTILVNGSIVTLDERRPQAQALALSYGRVVALGSDAEMRRLASKGTSLVNLDGKTVLPAFSDAHLHWEAQSRALRSVDVFEVADKSIAVERVRERVGETDPGEWVQGQGWAQDLWPERAFPTRTDLDAVAPRNPVYLSAKSGARRVGEFCRTAARGHQRWHRRSGRRPDPARCRWRGDWHFARDRHGVGQRAHTGAQRGRAGPT